MGSFFGKSKSDDLKTKEYHKNVLRRFNDNFQALKEISANDSIKYDDANDILDNINDIHYEQQLDYPSSYQPSKQSVELNNLV